MEKPQIPSPKPQADWERMLVSLRWQLRGRALARLAALGVLAAGFLVALGMGLDYLFLWSPGSRIAYAAVAVLAFSAGMGRALWRPLTAPLSDLDLVFLLEERLPDLDERLATAFQVAHAEGGIGSAEARSRLLARFERDPLAVDPGRVRDLFSRRSLTVPLFFCGVLAAAFSALAAASPLFRTGFSRWIPGSDARWTRLALDPFPGVLGEGEPVVLSGSVSGRIPSEAVIRIRGSEGAASSKVQRAPIEGGAFRHAVEGTHASFRILVSAGDDSSGWREVRVLRKPSVTSVRVEVVPPAYTGQEPKVQDYGDVTAFVGSRARFWCRVDQRLESGRIAFPGGERVPMTVGPDGMEASGEFVVSDRETAYSIVLLGADGLANDPPPQYRIRAIPDRPPTVEWARPLRSEIKAVAQARLRFAVRLADDTRVVSATARVARLPDEALSETPLSPEGGTTGFRVSLASFSAAEGDLLECTVEAVDEREPQPNRARSRPLKVRVVSTGEMTFEIDGDIARGREAAEDAFEKWLSADLVLAAAARTGTLGGADQATVDARQREGTRLVQSALDAVVETSFRIEENGLTDHYPPALFAAVREALAAAGREEMPPAGGASLEARREASRRALARLAEVRRLFLEWEDFSGIVRLTGRSVRAQEDVLDLLEGKRPKPDR